MTKRPEGKVAVVIGGNSVVTVTANTLLYRDADGLPEEHDQIVDVVMVHSGEATLMVGGTMAGQKGSAETGEYVGTALAGGESHPLAAGNIFQIPAGIPHSFLVPAGKHITYVLLKFPAKRQ
jgi:hypothetical protein